MDQFTLRRAEKKKSKLRIGISGPSGSGKTYSALLLAAGLASWDKICIVDTENGSADLYEHLGEYNVITLTAPFTPERYVEAIKQAEQAGMEVIIIDSMTHEWDGEGGCLEIAEQLTQASTSKNSYTAWGKVTPRHNKFVQAILQSNCHVITTVRRKQDYDMSKDDRGKTVVTKVGMKEITREGFEYELTLSFVLSQNHWAVASKDRTGLFMDQPEFTITTETGRRLFEWANSGSVDTPVIQGFLNKPVQVVVHRDLKDEAIQAIEQAHSTQKLSEIKERYLTVFENEQEVVDAGMAKYQLLTESARKPKKVINNSKLVESTL